MFAEELERPRPGILLRGGVAGIRATEIGTG